MLIFWSRALAANSSRNLKPYLRLIPTRSSRSVMCLFQELFWRITSPRSSYSALDNFSPVTSSTPCSSMSALVLRLMVLSCLTAVSACSLPKEPSIVLKPPLMVLPDAKVCCLPVPTNQRNCALVRGPPTL